MKVSYPLSLKVSLWLMLNLLLLAAVGIGLLVVQGGLGWSALVAGPSGDRMQSLANVIAGEVSAAPSGARTAVLKRFGAAYNAEFYLFTIDETQVAGSTIELPAEVRSRMEFRPIGIGAPFRPGGFSSRGGFRRRGESDPTRRPGSPSTGPADGAEKESREPAETPLPAAEKGATESAGKTRTIDVMRHDPSTFKLSMNEPHSGRFVVRAGAPAA